MYLYQDKQPDIGAPVFVFLRGREGIPHRWMVACLDDGGIYPKHLTPEERRVWSLLRGEVTRVEPDDAWEYINYPTWDPP